MASVLGLPEQKCEIIIKSIIHILKPHVMPYSKQQKNLKNFHICHFGLIEGKSLKLAKVCAMKCSAHAHLRVYYYLGVLKLK